MNLMLPYFFENDSINCVCIFFYTFIVAVICFWGGIIFRSRWIFPGTSNIDGANTPELQSHLAFISLSEYIRRRIQQSEIAVLNENTRLLNAETDTNSPIRIELQRTILIDSIIDCYIFPWYNQISGDQTFLEQSKHVLEVGFNRLRDKLMKLDRTNLVKDVIQILHYHWKEYCSALEKSVNTENEPLLKNFKFSHENTLDPPHVYKQHEFLLNILLKELIIPELNCNIFRQFLSGILMKSFIMYYINIVCEPLWINKALIALISNGSFSDCERNSVTHPVSPCCANISEQMQKYTLPEESQANKDKEGSADDNQQESTCEMKPLELCRTVESNFVDNSIHTLEEAASECISKQRFANYFPSGSPRYKKAGFIPGGTTTISAALGEIFSSTALPLLPEGYSYRFPEEINEQLDKQSSEYSGPSHRIYSPTNSYKEVRFAYPQDEPSSSQCKSKEELCGDQVTHVSSKSRHYSLQDYRKSKPTSADNDRPTTKSLDETKASQAFARQQEYDTKGDDQSLEDEKEASRLCKESEDFASTIAKLRCLLEQRESQVNLMDLVGTSESGQSLNNSGENENKQDLPEINKFPKLPVCKMKSTPLMGTGQQLRSDLGNDWSSSLEVEKLNSIMSELDESEAEVNCFFLNVQITKAESCSDLGAQSILYCIEYDGVYLECEKDGQPQKFVLRTTIVKRNFKDFVTLQTQLEGNPIWKPHLKGMKTPKKWLNISFTNQNAVSQRRAHLELYLQQLCYHRVLGFCKELRQFMAYGEDGYQAFGMPQSDIAASHKFENLTKTITEVFNTLREAVPHFESDLTTSTTVESVPSTNTQKKKMIPSFLNFEKYSLDSKKWTDATSKADGIQVQPEGLESTSEPQPDLKSLTREDQESPGIQAQENLMPELSNECGEEFVEANESIYPLAATVTQFLCDVLWLQQQRPHPASVSAFMTISGKSLENYLQETVELFLCEDAFRGYIDILISSLHEWSPQSEPTMPKNEFEPIFNQFDLKTTFKQKIPVWIRWMWGRTRSEETIDRLVGFFQSVELNRDLALSILELIFCKLVDSNEVK